MIFNNATTYAMRAVLYLSVHSSENNKIGIKELAAKLDVPYHFLGKILQTLARQDIICSIKGPNGGFYMTDVENNLTMMRVVEPFENKNLFNQCGLGLKECSEDHPCPIHDYYKEFRGSLSRNLKNQTIGEWAEKVRSGNVVVYF